MKKLLIAAVALFAACEYQPPQPKVETASDTTHVDHRTGFGMTYRGKLGWEVAPGVVYAPGDGLGFGFGF